MLLLLVLFVCSNRKTERANDRPKNRRCIVWKELGSVGLLPLLDQPTTAASSSSSFSLRAAVGGNRAPNDDGDCTPAATGIANDPTTTSDAAAGEGGGGSWTDSNAYLYPPDVDGALLDAYLAALEHPRFGPRGDQRCSTFSSTVGTVLGSLERCAGSADSGGGGGSGVFGSEREQHGEKAAAAATALVREVDGGSMRDVAVHHLACYLFPLPHNLPSSSDNDDDEDTWSSPRADAADEHGNGNPDGGGSGDNVVRKKIGPSRAPPLWRPDFGRRKMFKRLLFLGRGGASGGGGDAATVPVAVDVLGHECPGIAVATAVAAGGKSRYASVERCKRQDEEAEEGAGEVGETGKAKEASSPARSRVPRPLLSPQEGGPGGEACLWRSRPGSRRLNLLQSYRREYDSAAAADVVGLRGGDNAEGSGAPWLDEGRGVEDAVERLRTLLLL